jgi:hypothetical protein
MFIFTMLGSGKERTWLLDFKVSKRLSHSKHIPHFLSIGTNKTCENQVKEAVDGKKAQKEVAYGEYRGHTE